MQDSPRLLIFIKNPILGKVKTRLAGTLGPERALEIYGRLLGHTRQVAASFAGERWLFYSDFIDEQDDWDAREFRKLVQSPGDLGHRMERAFAQAFEAGPGSVLIIGSDCPLLSPAILEQALEMLQRKPLVMGPATDGGYYLLGMRQFTPALFRNMEWSTERVAQETLARAASLGLELGLLPELPDIDYEEDWERYQL